MAQAAAGLDLSCFAYLSMPARTGAEARLISNYPSAWTTHYLQRHYERFDPVIIQALGHPEPFEWGLGVGLMAASKSQELFEEAARFGIRYGFTIPIHDNTGPVAAVTFAVDERRPQFERTIR
jgi:LuxR family transcriptional activator of conjugal transfer of Ti plasmids